MEPIQLTPSRRTEGDMLPAESERTPEETSTQKSAANATGSRGMSTVRQDAEGAVHFLLFTSTRPAVLLARAWHVLGIPFAFEHMALYEEVALASRCFVVKITKAEAGGQEHLLFAARTPDVTAEECLASIGDSSVQAVVAEPVVPPDLS